MVPVVIQLLTLPMCPETPKYTLIVKNQAEQAEADLKKLRGREDVSISGSISQKVLLPGSSGRRSTTAMIPAEFQ